MLKQTANCNGGIPYEGNLLGGSWHELLPEWVVQAVGSEQRTSCVMEDMERSELSLVFSRSQGKRRWAGTWCSLSSFGWGSAVDEDEVDIVNAITFTPC